MGHYTEFVFAAKLKKNIPMNVIHTLVCTITEDDNITTTRLPNHPLFKTDRWTHIGSQSSQMFGYTRALSSVVTDQIDHQIIVSIRCSLKNYQGEIEKFVDWIKPYVESGSGDCNLLGYSIEEGGDAPVLYYLHKEPV